MPLISQTSVEGVVVRRAADAEVGVARRYATGEYWPINWSALWVGALSALAIALIVSLAGAAVGAHQLGPAGKIASWRDIGIGTLIVTVLGAFFSFLAGGWIAGKINGYQHAETDMLHGAIVWLLAVPMLVVLAAVGAGPLFGSWFGGLAGVPVWVTQNAATADPNAAAAARNAALGAITALLIGLVGAVLGGWLASGEPMSINLRRTALKREGATSR